MAIAGERGGRPRLLLVSGAPGSGKTAIAEALVALEGDALVFDAAVDRPA